MIGTVAVREIRLSCIVGIREAERLVPQPLEVAVEVDYDIDGPARSGRVEEAIDYSTLVPELVRFIADRRFGLLESLVSDSIAHLKKLYPRSTRIRLDVTKPHALKGTTGVPTLSAEVRYDGSPTPPC